jgi:hypothetical protein
MRIFRIVMIGLLAAAAGALIWRVTRTRARHSASAPSAQPSAQPSPSQLAIPPQQNASPQAVSATTAPDESAKRLGPFTITGRGYTVELRTRKIRPADTNDSGDTVVAMEIRDGAGAVQYRRVFPYAEAKEDYFEAWSASALLLSGTNGTGLLVSYDSYAEPSAPEEEPTGWFQVFGVLNGKLTPFGAPLEVHGGLLEEYLRGNEYKAAQAVGAHADEVEFKVWAGHCRLKYPVRVDWVKGKLIPAQECKKTAGELGAGCQYRVVPEDKLYQTDITFVRLWPSADEKSGPPMKTVVKKDSKVELLTALAATQWVEGNVAVPGGSSKGPLDDAGGFGVAPDLDLWLKVRIDGKEGWMHSEEDFRALGLPEDE